MGFTLSTSRLGLRTEGNEGVRMSKTKVVAVTVVSLGMVAVAGVAGFAVVSSTNASAPSDTITLLAAENPIATTPNFVPGELPPIVTLDQSSSRTPAQNQAEAAATTTQSTTSHLTPLVPTAPQPQATGAAKPTEITSLQARTAVLKEVQGTVTSVSEVTRNGYEAYAVKVAVNDGSTATGYVHKASGVVFDWDVVAAPASSNSGGAKAPAAPLTTSKTERDDDDHESEHKSPTQHTTEQKRPSSSHDEDDD